MLILQDPLVTPQLLTCVDAEDRMTIVARDVEDCPENSLPVTSSRPASTPLPEKKTETPVSPNPPVEDRSLRKFLEDMEHQRQAGLRLHAKKYQQASRGWKLSLSTGIPLLTIGSGLAVTGAVVGGLHLGAQLARAAANLEITAFDTKIKLLEEGIRQANENEGRPEDVDRLKGEVKDARSDRGRAIDDRNDAQERLDRLGKHTAPALIGVGVGLSFVGIVVLLLKGRRPKETDFTPYPLVLREGGGMGVRLRF